MMPAAQSMRANPIGRQHCAAATRHLFHSAEALSPSYTPPSRRWRRGIWLVFGGAGHLGEGFRQPGGPGRV
jgi:hypothetical protein